MSQGPRRAPPAERTCLDFAAVQRDEREAIDFRRRKIASGAVARLRGEGAGPAHDARRDAAARMDRRPLSERHLIGTADPVTAGSALDGAPSEAQPAEGISSPVGRPHLDAARPDVGPPRPGAAGPEKDARTHDRPLTGLALSGGGIRSASFCLGVLQALDSLTDHREPHVLDALDYLSTVSGGGYIGTSLSLGLIRGDGSFPFDSRLDAEETPETKHVRHYANFLVPRGTIDYLISAAIVIRGLLVNALIVTPPVLLLAVLTVLCDPFVADRFAPGVRALNLHGGRLPFGAFPVTASLGCAFAAALLGTAVWISLTFERSGLRARETLGTIFGVSLWALLLVAAFEIQPLVLRRFYESYDAATFGVSTFGNLVPRLGATVAAASAMLIPLAQKLANIVKARAGDSSWPGWTRKVLGRVALVLAGLAVPVLLWVEYLYLTFWALRPDPGHLNPFLPDFVNETTRALASLVPHSERLGQVGTGYAVAAIAMAGAVALIGPNANSLHRLYRDRLSRAFIFDRPGCGTSGKVDGFKFSWLKPRAGADYRTKAALAPFLLVNTAINLDGSTELKARGRRADVFTFSPRHAGSDTTGYATMEAFEEVVRDLGLTTAMAISGAAASANMGAHTQKVLTFSLSLLNIRLGYWLANPARLASFHSRSWRWLANVGAYHFLLESFGLLDQHRPNVYLTDGGHIENLGVYALLKRRCGVIVVVDAECDPAMTFPALVNLEVIARIDLGIRIELPWQAIRTSALADTTVAPSSAGRPAGAHGPHAAIGRIIYDEGQEGVLIYLKSSLSGDENDYVLDYKRRNGTFPHETTVDQFFTEEQFEAYRALGFHVARGLLTGCDGYGSLHPPPLGWQDRVRAALLSLNVPPKMAEAAAARA